MTSSKHEVPEKADSRETAQEHRLRQEANAELPAQMQGPDTAHARNVFAEKHGGYKSVELDASGREHMKYNDGTTRTIEHTADGGDTITTESPNGARVRDHYNPTTGLTDREIRARDGSVVEQTVTRDGHVHTNECRDRNGKVTSSYHYDENTGQLDSYTDSQGQTWNRVNQPPNETWRGPDGSDGSPNVKHVHVAVDAHGNRTERQLDEFNNGKPKTGANVVSVTNPDGQHWQESRD